MVGENIVKTFCGEVPS